MKCTRILVPFYRGDPFDLIELSMWLLDKKYGYIISNGDDIHQLNLIKKISNDLKGNDPFSVKRICRNYRE